MTAPLDIQVDIVITTKNNPIGLAQLCAALAVQTHRHFNVCLWDESDTSVLMVPQIARMLDVMAARGRVHLQYARNLASRGTPHAAGCAFRELTSSPYAWVIDDDCIPEPDALSRLLQTLVDQQYRPWAQGCFGDVTNSRAHANFMAGPQPTPTKDQPAYYFARYRESFVREIPFGEGGNLLYRRQALLDLAYTQKLGYFEAPWIEQYGNQSGIHIVVSALLGAGPLNTASQVYHLERPDPRFGFKNMRNEIIRARIAAHDNAVPFSQLAAIGEYLGLNNA